MAISEDDKIARRRMIAFGESKPNPGLRRKASLLATATA